jgi:hypothetical protein
LDPHEGRRERKRRSRREEEEVVNNNNNCNQPSHSKSSHQD